MAANEWDIKVNKLCYGCNKKSLFLDWSDQDCDLYRCSNCGKVTEIQYERMPSKIILIEDEDQDIRKEIWSR